MSKKKNANAIEAIPNGLWCAPIYPLNKEPDFPLCNALKECSIPQDHVKRILNSIYGARPTPEALKYIHLAYARQNGKTQITDKMIADMIENRLCESAFQRIYGQTTTTIKKEKNEMLWSKKNPNVEEVIVTPVFKPEPEEWIWVDGYKGTKKDMTCNGYQYVMNQQHNMEEGAEIVECHSGFHLCKNLNAVFKYYGIGDGNRYFKVRALVRKKDYDACGLFSRDKLVAKSIVFERELTVDEIFANNPEVSKWSQEDKLLALEYGVMWVINRDRTRALMELGYSESMAKYFVVKGLYDKAYAVGTQEGLGMDMKIFAIFVGE